MRNVIASPAMKTNMTLPKTPSGSKGSAVLVISHNEEEKKSTLLALSQNNNAFAAEI